MATIRFYDENGGATFILHSSLRNDVALYNKNKYFFVKQTVFERLIIDEAYIREVVNECGKPDIYFSYGIPMYSAIGKVNWFHVSNALSLTVKGIILPLSTRLKMLLLKARIQSTVTNMDIVSGESQYTLDLFKIQIRAKKPINYHILRNGYSSEDVSISGEVEADLHNKIYAMTIGIASYKRLHIVHNIFKQLQETNRALKTLYVVASPYDVPYMKALIPMCLKVDKDVVIDIFEKRDELVRLMQGMDYYISASQIENSSIALLEGLIFSKSIIVSDIPSHRELLSGQEYEYFYDQSSNENFIHYEKDDKSDFSTHLSWNDAVREMYTIGGRVC